MSNFEQSPFDPKQRDEQETYYIQKARRNSKSSANPPPPVPPKDRKYTHGGLNAPPAASHTRNQSAAYPALPTSRPAISGAPARRPVGSAPVPARLDLSNATTQQQRPTLQTSLSSGERTQRTIPLTHRDQDGKYHGQAYDSRPLLQSPIEQAYLPTTSSPAHHPSPSRPTSSSSRWSFGAKKEHADTISDDGSAPRPRSRAGSLTDKVFNGIANKARRASQSMKEKAEIVRMDASQRDEYCAKYAKAVSETSDDFELERQEDPRSRPFEQKRALLEKNRHLKDVVADTGSAMVEADYENMVATTEANRKINEAHAADYERRRAEAILRGEDIPNLSRVLPTAELSLTPSQRSSARISVGIVKEEAVKTSKPELSATDKMAVRMGKTLDKLHLQNRGRSSTLESEMSFADIAVPGAMEVCSGCGEPPKGVLRDGMCTRCRTQKKITTHQAAKSAMKETSASRFVGAQNVLQEADPDSPPWMRVAAQKKMRKVRRTVYADPGNPFATEDDRDSVEFTSLPFTPVVVDTTFTNHRPDRQPDTPEVTCLLNGQPFDDASESPANGRVPFGSHPDDLVPPPPTPGLQSTPTLMKADRHVSQQVMTEIIEASPRSSWRIHPRSLIPGSPITPRVRDRDVRNTQFYGFYNDIFSDYQDKRDSLLGARR